MSIFQSVHWYHEARPVFRETVSANRAVSVLAKVEQHAARQNGLHDVLKNCKYFGEARLSIQDDIRLCELDIRAEGSQLTGKAKEMIKLITDNAKR
jgi:hypothetical protein